PFGAGSVGRRARRVGRRGLRRRRRPAGRLPGVGRRVAGGGDREADARGDRRLRRRAGQGGLFVSGVSAAGGQARSQPLLGGAAEPTLMELSHPGRKAWSLPASDVPELPLEEMVPAWAMAAEPPPLPEVAE